MLHLAQSGQDQLLTQRAHNLMGATLHFLGEFTEARTHLEQVMGFSDSQQLQSHALFEGQAAPTTCRSIGSWVLWTLGYPDQALTRSLEALNLAHDSLLPFILAMALYFSAVVYNLRREGRAAQEQAEASI